MLAVFRHFTAGGLRAAFSPAGARGSAAVGLPLVICGVVAAAVNLGLVTGSLPGAAPGAASIAAVPFVKQQANYCGPAAMASVLQFYGDEVTQEEIAEEIYLSEMRGSLNIDLLLYPRKRGGYATAQSKGDLAALKAAVARGRPVICQLREKSGLVYRFHFVVVFGYDDATGSLLMHSGNAGNELREYADFDKAWQRADCWMLVIRPEGPQPAAGEDGPPQEVAQDD